MFKYRTKFNLEAPVLDMEAAQEYLSEDSMAEYLREDLDDSCDYFTIPMSHLRDKVISLEWHLEDSDSGYIELCTKTEFTPGELAQISEWVSGQNSDGLGEGFEQQDFANYENSGWCGNRYDEDDCEDMWVMASFDWETNKYIFSLYEHVSSPEEDCEAILEGMKEDFNKATVAANTDYPESTEDPTYQTRVNIRTYLYNIGIGIENLEKLFKKIFNKK